MTTTPKRGRPKTVDRRQFERAAETGAEFADICAALRVPRAYVEAHRPELLELWTEANARFRLSVARRMAREGVGRGRAHALLALGRQHLGFDKPSKDGTRPVLPAVAVEELCGLLDKLEAKQSQDHEPEADE